jgi:hypothetical protein
MGLERLPRNVGQDGSTIEKIFYCECHGINEKCGEAKEIGWIEHNE